MNDQSSYYQGRLVHRRHMVGSLKKRADERRSFSEKVADWMRSFFGNMDFLIINVTLFVLWIILNIGVIPGIIPFDPYPFGFLTMIVSLEAIVLSIFVLISQNRAAKVDDLREEIDLQVDAITEEEITKVMEIVTKIAEKQGIDLSQDKILKDMLKPLDERKIERDLEKQFE